ncbi:glycosyltransferase family 2 protein [uncultured Bacteroides sp.]|uniref:glycosyltransferase family 2 protein n=1 Tax=uncultured Bacteroides sp. TaxID=162156 RepID=UPI0025D503B8|nr:glycosyltransferase family 2 protein [uncultured Bacteroides sp.]
MMNTPIISVITICYNAIANIEETMLSVLNQQYDKVEYIVIDGGSKDGTLDIIKKYTNRLAYWTSEPDQGIYDAMNKGIAKATGEWINFMNAGDIFIDEEVLNRSFANSYKDDVDILYGDVVYQYKFGKRLVKAGNIEQIMNHMVFSHQSTFVRRILIQKGFDIKWKLAADYNLLLGYYWEGRKYKHIDVAIAIVEMDDGATYNNYSKSRKEVLRIHEKFNYSFFKRYKLYFVDVFRFYISRIIKYAMPKNLLHRIYNVRIDDLNNW